MGRNERPAFLKVCLKKVVLVVLCSNEGIHYLITFVKLLPGDIINRLDPVEPEHVLHRNAF